MDSFGSGMKDISLYCFPFSFSVDLIIFCCAFLFHGNDTDFNLFTSFINQSGLNC
jgi:hypothetical protein